MALSVKDLAVWSVPLGMAAIATVLGVRVYRQRPWEPPPVVSVAPLPTPCPEGVYRCREREVTMTTGEIAGDGKSCIQRRVGGCVRACVSPRVSLAGIDDATAKAQLCDPPRKVDGLVSEERSFLSQPIADAAICEGDGYIPSEDGFVQCVLKSGNDPNATGVITGRVRCRLGAVPTTDRAPRLIKREEAIAVWCKRDPAARPETDEAETSDATLEDAATDAKSDAKSGG